MMRRLLKDWDDAEDEAREDASRGTSARLPKICSPPARRRRLPKKSRIASSRRPTARCSSRSHPSARLTRATVSPVAGTNKGRVQLRFPGGHEGYADPREVYVALSGPRINVAVPLRNVGNGLAVIHPAQVQLLGPRMLPQRVGEYVTKIERPRVPPGETTRILHAPTISATEMADYPWNLTMRVPYWDFAGEEGWVALLYLEQAYQDEPWSLRWMKHEPFGSPAAEGQTAALTR